VDDLEPGTMQGISVVDGRRAAVDEGWALGLGWLIFAGMLLALGFLLLRDRS
jgi:hypothetical protein